MVPFNDEQNSWRNKGFNKLACSTICRHLRLWMHETSWNLERESENEEIDKRDVCFRVLCHSQTLLKCFAWFIAEIKKNVNCCVTVAAIFLRGRRENCERATSDCLYWLQALFVNNCVLPLHILLVQTQLMVTRDEMCCALWIKQTTNCFVFASVEISKAVHPLRSYCAPNHVNNSASS